MELFSRKQANPTNGLFCLCLALALLLIPFLYASDAAADPDGATEALQLRYQAEIAISQERASGHPELADAMFHSLPGLLQEYLVTRDGTIALDTVDAAFVQEQFKVARAAEEPGVALALDVYSGPGTGYEHGLRTAIANLADFNGRMDGRVSEAALDAHERVMEQQMEKIERHLDQTEALENRLESKMESKLGSVSKMTDARGLEARGLEAKIEEKAEIKAEAVAKKVESKVENILQQAEKVEPNPEKAQRKIEEDANPSPSDRDGKDKDRDKDKDGKKK